jgi:hypothetical protein
VPVPVHVPTTIIIGYESFAACVNERGTGVNENEIKKRHANGLLFICKTNWVIMSFSAYDSLQIYAPTNDCSPPIRWSCMFSSSPSLNTVFPLTQLRNTFVVFVRMVNINWYLDQLIYNLVLPFAVPWIPWSFRHSCLCVSPRFFPVRAHVALLVILYLLTRLTRRNIHNKGGSPKYASVVNEEPFPLLPVRQPATENEE